MSLYFVYITTKDTREAEKIGRSLVELRLARCVNIVPGMRSIYLWQDKICDENECILIAKTSEEHLESVRSEVKRLHSYDVPCIVWLKLDGGDDAYLQWLGS
jgi:periplasmic divalent cation tolerance protein